MVVCPQLLPARLQGLLLGGMEHAAGRLPLGVLGENEALQQFFSGEQPPDCAVEMIHHHECPVSRRPLDDKQGPRGLEFNLWFLKRIDESIERLMWFLRTLRILMLSFRSR